MKNNMEGMRASAESLPHERLQHLYREVLVQGRLMESNTDRVKRVGPEVVGQLRQKRIQGSVKYRRQSEKEDYVATVTSTIGGYIIVMKFNKRVEGMTTRGVDVFPANYEFPMRIDDKGILLPVDGDQLTVDDYEKAAYCLSTFNRLLKDPKAAPVAN